MAQIAILNYSDGTVTVRELPNHICDCEEIEQWIESELGIKINDVHVCYMSSDNLKINIDVHNVSQSIEFNYDK